MRTSFPVYVMAILLIGCLLATITQCRPGRAGTGANYTTSSDGAGDGVGSSSCKLFLKFCIKKTCAGKGGSGPWLPDCYCCQNLPNQPCFDTEQQCRRKCPSCNPRCPAGDGGGDVQQHHA